MESERNLMTTMEAVHCLGLKPGYRCKMRMRRAIPTRRQREPALMSNRNGVSGRIVPDKETFTHGIPVKLLQPVPLSRSLIFY